MSVEDRLPDPVGKPLRKDFVARDLHACEIFCSFSETHDACHPEKPGLGERPPEDNILARHPRREGAFFGLEDKIQYIESKGVAGHGPDKLAQPARKFGGLCLCAKMFRASLLSQSSPLRGYEARHNLF